MSKEINSSDDDVWMPKCRLPKSIYSSYSSNVSSKKSSFDGGLHVGSGQRSTPSKASLYEASNSGNLNSREFHRSKTSEIFIDEEDSDDEDPWDEETETENARLREEEESADIAAAMKSGGKPASTRLRVKPVDPKSKLAKRGPSLKKWFKEVLEK
jgi:hypothetical protein